MEDKSKRKNTIFTEITTSRDLITYLNDSSKRLQERKYLYHYTKLPNLFAMFQSKCWHLGNAKDMNDLLEYKNGDSTYWNNLFFASFMTESKESIAMWSMYAQPWEKGIKIALPVSVVKKWIKNCTEILEVDSDSKKVTGRKIKIGHQEAAVWLSSVAYSNTQSLESNNTEEEVWWSNQRNKKIKCVNAMPDLTGYIKDRAWDYEKEIRLKAKFNNIQNFKRVAIEMTDEVLDSMIITAGPLFEGNLLEEIEEEIHRNIETDTSLFSGNLKLESICKNCSYKNR